MFVRYVLLQVVGEVKPPRCNEDVHRYYKYIEAEEAWLAAQQG
jgi:hypothetical protein